MKNLRVVIALLAIVALSVVAVIQTLRLNNQPPDLTGQVAACQETVDVLATSNSDFLEVVASYLDEYDPTSSYDVVAASEEGVAAMEATQDEADLCWDR